MIQRGGWIRRELCSHDDQMHAGAPRREAVRESDVIEKKRVSRAGEPTKNDRAQVGALVNRQVQAWEKRDFAIAADDWLPNGELFSLGGHVLKKDMQSAILGYFKNFTDLKVTVNEMFLSEDSTRLAIQWDWTVTCKRDRKRTTTHDAILVHLVGGKIATWNEYFG